MELLAGPSATLLGYAAGLRRNTETERDPELERLVEKTEVEVRRLLGEEFETHFRRGQEKDLDAAVALEIEIN
jgi:hypothetical protein